MLEEVLGVEGSLLHQPLVRRAPGGLPESPDEMPGRHAASPAELVGGRRVAEPGKENFLGDALLPRREPASAALAGRYVRVVVDQMRYKENRDFINKKLRAPFWIVKNNADDIEQVRDNTIVKARLRQAKSHLGP